MEIKRSYYDNKKVCVETVFDKGELVSAKSFDKAGRIINEASYKENKPHGLTKSYNKGELVLITVYDGGRRTHSFRLVKLKKKK